MNKKAFNHAKTKIPNEARSEFVVKTQKYLQNQYDTELGEFEVEEIFDFFCEKLGKLFYNQGIVDARNFLTGRFLESTDDIVQLELND